MALAFQGMLRLRIFSAAMCVFEDLLLYFLLKRTSLFLKNCFLQRRFTVGFFL